MAEGHVQSFEINGPTVLFLASKWQVRGGGKFFDKKVLFASEVHAKLY
jgi:hypothetical protein